MELFETWGLTITVFLPVVGAVLLGFIKKDNEDALKRTALLFTAGISVLAACAFGLLPAFRLSGSRLGSLQQAGRGIVGRRRLGRARGGANRVRSRPAGWRGAAHAQLLAAQPGRRRV